VHFQRSLIHQTNEARTDHVDFSDTPLIQSIFLEGKIIRYVRRPSERWKATAKSFTWTEVLFHLRKDPK